MSTMTLHDITLTYDDEGGGDGGRTGEGGGDVLVLVHGHPFDRSMWRPQLDTFAGPGRRVIAPDLRGYGGATVLPGKTTLTTFAWDLAALLDRLGVDRVVLGGLSMGGQIVLEFYRLFPERVRAWCWPTRSPPPRRSRARWHATRWPTGCCGRAWGRTWTRC